MERINVGDTVQHFKREIITEEERLANKYLYKIVGFAVHSESREKMVVYQALYDDFGLYVRPYDMFMSEVDREKYPEIKQKYRFERVSSMHSLNGECYTGEGDEIMEIRDAKHLERGVLLIHFSTGEYRLFDSSCLTGKVFEPLKDDTIFGAFEIEHGVITWLNGKIDCAPEFMYQHSMKDDKFD